MQWNQHCMPSHDRLWESIIHVRVIHITSSGNLDQIQAENDEKTAFCAVFQTVTI